MCCPLASTLHLSASASTYPLELCFLLDVSSLHLLVVASGLPTPHLILTCLRLLLCASMIVVGCLARHRVALHGALALISERRCTPFNLFNLAWPPSPSPSHCVPPAPVWLVVTSTVNSNPLSPLHPFLPVGCCLPGTLASILPLIKPPPLTSHCAPLVHDSLGLVVLSHCTNAATIVVITL